MENKFETENAFITFEGQIITVKYKKDAEIELKDAQKISQIILKNANKYNKYGMINDATEMKNMSRHARDFLAKHGKKAKFNAIIIKSNFTNLLAKMYFNFSKPKIPTKIFYNLEDALTWLEEKLK